MGSRQELKNPKADQNLSEVVPDPTEDRVNRIAFHDLKEFLSRSPLLFLVANFGSMATEISVLTSPQGGYS